MHIDFLQFLQKLLFAYLQEELWVESKDSTQSDNVADFTIPIATSRILLERFIALWFIHNFAYGCKIFAKHFSLKQSLLRCIFIYSYKNTHIFIYFLLYSKHNFTKILKFKTHKIGSSNRWCRLMSFVKCIFKSTGVF